MHGANLTSEEEFPSADWLTVAQRPTRQMGALTIDESLKQSKDDLVITQGQLQRTDEALKKLSKKFEILRLSEQASSIRIQELEQQKKEYDNDKRKRLEKAQRKAALQQQMIAAELAKLDNLSSTASLTQELVSGTAVAVPAASETVTSWIPFSSWFSSKS